jgi:hypothetical protein
MPNVNIPTSDQISLDALVTLQNNTSIVNVSQGTLARAIVTATSKIMGTEYSLLTSEVATAFIRTSTGSYLDLIGQLLSMPRGGSSTAMGASSQKFYSADGVTPILNLTGADALNGIIPAGTIVSSSNGSIRYQVTQSVILGLNDVSVVASVASINTGSGVNIGANILQTHNLNVTNLLTTNIVPISNASDMQGDTEYKQFLAGAVTAAEAANPTAVRLAALSVQEVSDIRITRYYNGIGTFGVLVIGTTPIVSNSTLNDVANAIALVTSTGEWGAVRPPRYVGIEIGAKLIFSSNATDTDKVSITSTATDTLYNYVNNIPLGQGIVRNEVIQRIMDTSSLIIDVDDNDTSPTQLSIYTWTPTVVDIALDGTVTTNRVRQKLVRNFTPNWDDKTVVEANIQGYTHEASFNPISLTY